MMDIIPRNRIIEKYYDSLEGMLARFEACSLADRFTGETGEELLAWQQEKRGLLWSLLGLDRLLPSMDPGVRAGSAEEADPGDDRITVEGVEELADGVIRRKVIFRVDEYTLMPMYVLEPPGESRGTFLALAGHQGAGKYTVAGVREIPCVSERIDFFNYDYGLKLAKLGYTAICPDPRGMGERRDLKAQGDDPADFLSCSCRHLNHMAVPLGLSVAGLCTYDYIRLLDYIESTGRWNPEHMGCLGFSGGGYQTLMLSALDDRIKMSFISGYMYGVRDALLVLNNNCSCNYVPGMWEHFDMGDVACMIAPRPLFIQSCEEDHLNGARGMTNVYEQVDIIRNAYGLCGCADRVVHDVRPGDHHFFDEPLAETVKLFEEMK